MSDSEIVEPAAKKFKKSHEKCLIIILEAASLETALMDKKHQLLHVCERYKSFAKKNKLNLADYRPDITHQCLLMLLDSPLNRAGLLKVYIRTEKNVLIEVNPRTRIPRTFDRFCGLIAQLLQESSVGEDKLLRVIKNPITNHLPAGCMKIATSFAADEVVVDPSLLLTDDSPIVFVVGAFANGSVDVNYTEKTISMSNYPLSAALTCTKLCDAFERKWNIL